MKADCNGCKALQQGMCVLGYKIILECPDDDCYYVPTEQCLKPRTHKRLKEIQEERAKA